MGCGCNNRSNLIRRSIVKLKNAVVPARTKVKSRTGSVELTPKGYVKTCTECGTEGTPSGSPDTTKLNCTCETQNDKSS